MLLFLLGWLVASVPVGLVLGWLCGVNNLSRDEGELPLSEPAVVAPRSVRQTPDSVPLGARTRARRCTLPHQAVSAGGR